MLPVNTSSAVTHNWCLGTPWTRAITVGIVFTVSWISLSTLAACSIGIQAVLAAWRVIAITKDRHKHAELRMLTADSVHERFVNFI